MEEISAENLNELQKRYRTTVFIVLIQIFTTVVLIAAAGIITMSRTAPPSDDSYLTLWMVVLFLAAGTFILRRRLFSWERLKNVTLLKGIPGLLGALRFNAIFLNSLAEVVVILGFIISMLSGNPFDVIRTGLIALIVFLLNFPRRSVWEKIVLHLEKI